VSRKLDRLFGQEPPAGGQFPFTYAATVTRSTLTEVWFTLDDEDEYGEFPPAAYPKPGAHAHGIATESQHNHGGTTTTTTFTPNKPPKGTALAVAFAQGDPDRPMVLAIYGWPS